MVYMPYGPLERPSLALGVLKVALQRANISCEVQYPNLRFAEWIGTAAYADLAWVREENMGEWTFSGAAFPEFTPNHAEYMERVTWIFARDEREAEAACRVLWEIRHQATRFVDQIAREIVAQKPRILACSSTFQQHCAVLALTRRVKELDPSIVTVLGGANCEAEMGVATLLEFGWVDYVISGEAEVLFPELCRNLLQGLKMGNDAPGILGPAYRLHPEPYKAPPRATANLDQSPIPDFDDYFAELKRFSRPSEIRPALMVESSRGCWWGAIKHCKFCGLNGGSMEFRFKKAERVLEELDTLSARYGIRYFLVVDNILPLDYFETLLPKLAERGAPYHLFYEIKANISYKQLQLLRQAGVSWLQPGIESLHDDALKLMNKGTPAWNNVQLLKWARELGTTLTWNYLCGFPGEQDSWYSEVSEWVAMIEHLQPGRELRPIRYDRFSPYQVNPEQYGIQLQANWAYSYVYPLPPEKLAKLVYIFHGEGEMALNCSPFRIRNSSNRDFPSLGTPGRDALQESLRHWHQSFMSSLPCILAMEEFEDHTEILDTRRIKVQTRVELRDLQHRVHRTLHGAQPLRVIAQMVAQDGGPEVSEEQVEQTLAELQQRKLVVKLGGRYLGLAVRGNLPALPKRNEDGYPGGWINRTPALLS